MSTLKEIHEIVHEKLGKLYATCEEDIAKVEPTTENWSEEIFGESSKCDQMMKLKSVVLAIEEDSLIQALGKQVFIEGEEDFATQNDCYDEWTYNPFSNRTHGYSTDDDSGEEPDPFADDDEIAARKEAAEERRAKKKEVEKEIVGEDDDIFKLIASICEFEEFRKL